MLVESVVALSQEERENLFECYKRIIQDEIDKEVMWVAIANLRLMIERLRETWKTRGGREKIG